MINYDIISSKIGSTGKSQMIMFFMLSYYMIFAGFNALATVFIAYMPEFRCNVAPLDLIVTDEEQLLKYTTPYDAAKGKYDRCMRYDFDLSSCDANLTCVDQSSAVSCDQGYTYDRSVITQSVLTEFDLVCDSYYLVALSTSMFQVGYLVGSLLFGNLADRFGRKTACVVTYLCGLACSYGVGYSTSITVYMVLRALTAAFTYGTTIGSFVYVMELVEVQWRTVFGIGYQVFFPIGYMIQSAIAYRWRDWHQIMLACNIVASPFLLFAILLPESPRWLFTTNKTEQGKKVVARIVRFNGHPELDTATWQEAEEDEQKNEEVAVKYSTLDLFKLPGTRKVTINVMFSWFVNSLVYYGISLNAGSLAGDIFLNNTLNGVMEIFSYILAAVLLDRLGRRLTLAGGYLIASIGLIVSLIMVELTDKNQNLQTVGVVFAFVGKIGISGAFAIIYNMTSELFPTVTRSNGVAMGSVAARVGGILAPFIISIQTKVRWLPNTIFGVLGVLAAVSAFAFPETSGFKMMETVEEAEHFYRHGVSTKEKSDLKRADKCGKNNEAFSDLGDIEATKM